MFCTKCGNQMEASERFCGNCGAPNASFDVQPADQDSGYTAQPAAACEMPNEAYAPEATENVYTQFAPEQPVSAPKKGISPLKIGLIALAAVVVIAAVVVGVFVSGVFDDNTTTLMKAFAKTAEAYSGVGDELGMPDLSRLEESQESSQSFSLWIEELDETPEAEGFGIRMDVGSSMPEREMDMILTPFYGSVDLLDLELKFDDAALYVGSPELTGDTYYRINMDTLGDDLAGLGAGDELAGFGFNFFELVELMNSGTAVSEDALENMEKAFENFEDSFEIEEKGTETIEVNGRDVSCTAYQVTITQEAFESVLDALEAYTDGIDVTAVYTDMFAAMGLPQDMIDEMEESLAGTDVYGEMFSVLRDALDELGDLALDVYVSDGYVMSVVYEDAGFAISLDLGGGDNFADDLSLTLEAAGSEMALISSGNHTGKGGLLTDETKLIIDGETLMTSDFSYDAQSDDLFWEIGLEEVCIYLEGQLTTEKEGFSLRVDELGVTVYGESMGLVLGFEYSIGAYEGSIIEVEESVELLKMSEADLEAAGEEIMMNAYMWLTDLAQEIPALQDILGSADF